MRIARVTGILLTLCAAAAAGTAAAAPVTGITGAGSTFAYPVYGKWAAVYEQRTGIGLNYQSIGSGAGIRQVRAGTVAFGATDWPLDVRKLHRDGLWQWPQLIGGVVPVVNLPGIAPGRLVLDARVLAGIYLGRLHFWDAPEIRALNPGVTLPHVWIAPVYRADASGTTFVFTHYLSTADAGWRRQVGANTMVEWPVGIGAKGNEAVANMVRNTRGAIGYIEYTYVLQAKLDYTRLINPDGRAVAPSLASFEAAASHALFDAATGFDLTLDNQPGAASWPITGATFVLIPRRSGDPHTTVALLRFFDWGFRHGRDIASSLGYVLLPDEVIDRIEASWSEHLRGPTGGALWPPSDAAP
ncbi:MAG TPA: phosphate ABC transporter substrate-binding protein PstS [Nevskiaceae bacterium]